MFEVYVVMSVEETAIFGRCILGSARRGAARLANFLLGENGLTTRAVTADLVAHIGSRSSRVLDILAMPQAWP